MFKIFFDTETTGLPSKDQKWETDFNEYPRTVQIAWIITNDAGEEVERTQHFIKSDGWEIPDEAIAVHGITNEVAKQDGVDAKTVFKAFLYDAKKCGLLIGHNIHYDTSIIKADLLRLGFNKEEICKILHKDKRYCTMFKSMKILGLKKWPKLSELFFKLFNEELTGAHTAIIDAEATKKIYYKLTKLYVSQQKSL